MIDKLKELENLENKYKEIGRINSEIESIIANIKNEAGISREKELLEENERLSKDLKAFHEKMKVREEEIGRLKNSNAVLIEELKEAKKVRRNGEIDKFQNILAEKMNVELESGVTRRLSNYAEEMKRKVKMLERNLSHEFSDEADSLRYELKKINEKIGDFLEKSNRKTFENKVFLQEESSVFHNKIKEETALKEGEFLFEREKKRFVFEKLIGLKGFNFLGIISIFLGVFLVFRTQFAKILANNYVKSSASYLLGMFFLFAGEKFYQKNKKHFAVGLIGGGIGILYLTTLLSTLYLKLYPMTAGLFISVILTGLVVILSLRYDSQIIGVLSLIGGYLPYGAYIWVNKSNVQIYYVLAYSLILQGIVLGVSWKKDWIYSKIFGFVTGVVNMTGLVYYLNYSIHDKITAFFYIVIFTTAYSFIFLNSHKKENRQSTTYAVISDGNFNIGSQKGKENIESIKKSTKQEANKLEKIDYSQMQKEVEQDVATIQAFAKNVGGATDEAYRTMFIAEHRMFTHKVDEKGNPIKDPEILKKINEEADAKGLDRTKYLKQQLEKGRNIYLLHELSDQERNQLQKVTYTDPKTGKTESKYVVAFNGIFNDRNSAAKFAVQNYVAGRDEKTGDINKRLYKDAYFVHHPKANNAFSELLVAGYEKMFEGSFGNLLGMDNSSLQAMNMMKQYGKDDLYLGSHSRGTLTVSNALKALNTEDNREKKLLSNTTVKMVGPAADVTRADGYLSQLQTGKERTASNGSIRIENHASDPVGSMPILLGGNPATTSENNLNKGLVERISDIFGDNSSVHNCHGLGQRQCITDGYRTEGDLKMGNEQTIFNLNKSKGE